MLNQAFASRLSTLLILCVAVFVPAACMAQTTGPNVTGSITNLKPANASVFTSTEQIDFIIQGEATNNDMMAVKVLLSANVFKFNTSTQKWEDFQAGTDLEDEDLLASGASTTLEDSNFGNLTAGSYAIVGKLEAYYIDTSGEAIGSPKLIDQKTNYFTVTN